SPCYDAVHRRRVVFVADEYWIIEDELRGERMHRFDLRFHLAPDAEGCTTIADGGGHPVVRAPGFALVVAPPDVPRLEAGWVSDAYAIKTRAPVVSVAVEGLPAVTFTTLVVPLRPDAVVPSLEVQHHDAATVVVVRGLGGSCDWVGWRPDVGPL